MRFQLPPPTYWQDFEDLCYLVWVDIWDDPHAQKVGRPGESQAGVDIVHEEPNGTLSRWFGVQCKLRDQLLGGTLEKEEVLALCDQAEAFTPPLSCLTIATTAPRSSTLQADVRQIDADRRWNRKFAVQVYGWDDISDVICSRPHLIKLIYGDKFAPLQDGMQISPGTVSLVVRSLNPIAECCALFESDAARRLMSEQLRLELCNIATELSLNAVQHGRAQSVCVRINTHGLEIEDNGQAFDPIAAISSNRTGSGLLYLSHFLSKRSHDVSARFERPHDRNLFRLVFSGPLTTNKFTEECLIARRANVRYLGSVLFDEFVDIPADCPEYIFEVPPGAFNPSSFVMFTISLGKRIPVTSRVTMRFSKLDDIMRKVALTLLAEGTVSPAQFVIE